MANIAVIGTGYVGLTTAVCLADLGHHVTGVDIDEKKVAKLRKGEPTIYEPGLADLMTKTLQAGRLTFTQDYNEAIPEADFVFIAVGTPPGRRGEADLVFVKQAAKGIANAMKKTVTIVNKSTVPIGTGNIVARIVGENLRDEIPFYVVSNPEFLREGSAIHDFMHPDRLVFGSHDAAASRAVADLYSKLDTKILITDLHTAEMIKYASNAFLATRISFINEMARICERVDADVKIVSEGMGMDHRIGPLFLDAGIGYGGSCLVGDETVIIRQAGHTRLLPLTQLFAEFDESARIEVLSWERPGTSPQFLPVAAVTRRDVEGDILEIRTKMGRRVRCTPDHPFVTGSGTKLAEQLTDNDWLPLAQFGPDSTAGVRFEILADLATAGLQVDDIIVRPSGALLALTGARSLQRSLTVARSHDVVRTGAIRLTEMEGLGLPLAGSHLKTARNGTMVPLQIVGDAAFWRIVGLYVAEGCLSSDGGRRRIKWSFNPREESDLVGEVLNFWTSLGVRAEVRRAPTSTTVTISSRLLAGFWQGRLGLGANSYRQRIPDPIWTAPAEHKRAFLSGLWRGDGSWSYVNGGPSVILEYGTASRQLADGILRLLGDIGIVASLRVGRTAKSTVDNYWTRVSGADQVEQLLEFVADRDRGVILGSLARQSKRINSTGFRRFGNDPTAWVRVVSIERQPFAGAVYSIEVPGTHTFVTTGGLVTHNCFPKDVKALARMAETMGYHPELLDAVMEINLDQRTLVVEKLREVLGGLRGQVIGILGLAYKPNTDDIREAPAIDVIESLLQKGADVRAYDPKAMPVLEAQMNTIKYCKDAYAVATGADALLVVTEWDEFRQLDLERVKKLMRRPVIVDGRNLFDPKMMRDRGFVYRGVGRS